MTEGCRWQKAVSRSTKIGIPLSARLRHVVRKPCWAEPKTNTWNFGPRDKVSGFLARMAQRQHHFTPRGDVVHLDLRHSCDENCSNVYRSSANWRKLTWVPIRLKKPILARPTAHYTMGGIETDQHLVKPALKVCSLSANVPLLVCMALTVWLCNSAELVVSRSYGR